MENDPRAIENDPRAIKSDGHVIVTKLMRIILGNSDPQSIFHPCLSQCGAYLGGGLCFKE